MKKRVKTRFVSRKIRKLRPEELSGLEAVISVLSGDAGYESIAMIPSFVSVDGKQRSLLFSKFIADKILRDHGELLPENFVINANDWDGVLINVRSFRNGVLESPNLGKINLIKKIPNSNNFLLIAAEKQNGFFILTHFETIVENGNQLKSLLGRGDLLGPTGTPLGPADFLSAPSPKAFLRGVSGSGDHNNIAKNRE